MHHALNSTMATELSALSSLNSLGFIKLEAELLESQALQFSPCSSNSIMSTPLIR